MKMMRIAAVLALVVWVSWLCRYEVTMLPLAVRDLRKQPDGSVLAADGSLHYYSQTTNLVMAFTNGDGTPFFPAQDMAAVTLLVRDRWTGDSAVKTVGWVDKSDHGTNQNRIKFTPAR
jgi:hypothetical protein